MSTIHEKETGSLSAEEKREIAYRDVKMYMANDWELDGEFPEYFLLKKNTGSFGKHLVVFIFLGWWTFLIANVIYYFVSKKQKKILK